MFEMLDSVNWEEYNSLLFDGNPSMFTQFMVFNGLIALVWSYRKWRKYRPLPQSSVKTYKSLFVIINALILFQDALNLRSTADLILS